MNLKKYFTMDGIPKEYMDPYDKDTGILFPLYRNLSYFITKKIKHWKISPSNITFASLVFGLLTGYLFYLGEHKFLILGAISLFIAHELDFIDGIFARMTNQQSRVGKFIDHISDAFKQMAIFLGATWGVYNLTNDVRFWILGFIAATTYLLARFLYGQFRSIFDEVADKIVKQEKIKRKFIKEFFYDGQQTMTIVLLAALFNKMDWLLILLGIYGPIFIIVEFIVILRRIKKIDPKSFSKY